jgi:uncharacterized membrane protein
MILGKSPMWAPLGSVLAFGLIFSMIFTLFIVPVMYYKLLKDPIPKDETPEDQLEDEVILYRPKTSSLIIIISIFWLSCKLYS